MALARRRSCSSFSSIGTSHDHVLLVCYRAKKPKMDRVREASYASEGTSRSFDLGMFENSSSQRALYSYDLVVLVNLQQPLDWQLFHCSTVRHSVSNIYNTPASQTDTERYPQWSTTKSLSSAASSEPEPLSSSDIPRHGFSLRRTGETPTCYQAANSTKCSTCVRFVCEMPKGWLTRMAMRESGKISHPAR